MSIVIINKNKLKSSSLTLLTDTIYNNFIELKNVSNLSHTKSAILETLTSKYPQVYFIMVNNKIAAYLIGQIMTLNDGRTVLYITYLYTAEQFRGSGYASKLLETAESVADENRLSGIMLTCDSENTQTYDFYSKRGFMPDLNLRTYQKYEVMFKY